MWAIFIGGTNLALNFLEKIFKPKPAELSHIYPSVHIS
ncbi:hypothetical protein GY50_1298 [Dehalococcoides mccartyi GY50]|nr:hypothetical protein GY50_1298 [Dehalococcoides mccartyi GY50]